ncbi:hypothetical protein [Tropicibacter naphthalenivorans]|uniref:Uncharacterized protein n=1 Tax=Tropicibacter naphthalenivorans TaxID=441103 RepID=A0A0P1GKC7_9RHOB|nr:hypothetical protein [Tropicibacter naphthalenivorans]CUH82493.1 hypothetical protein TRN7648_04035 [Tropicibacter naphthalenivorans]SMD07012.1 hypothetical protein SAMN04488093_11525 [Tropicibacter naphthalenivorans]
MSKFAGYGAAGLSLLWAIVHTFLGGPEIAAPLLASDLPQVVRATAWMVWHMTTGVLFLLALGFALATYLSARSALVTLTALSATLMCAGIFALFKTGTDIATLPQALLFLPVLLLGLAAIRPLAPVRTIA